MNPQELKATVSIALLYIVRMLGLFMVLPVLPLMADSIEAATPFLIGLALGAYGLSQAVLQIPMGIWSDRFGRKKIIAMGLVVFIMGSLVAGLSDDIYGIILGRFLQGCGAIASTLLALVGDVTRSTNRSKAMAIVGMSIGASFGIALVLGPFINVHYGVSGLFYVTAALGVVGLLLLTIFPAASEYPTAVEPSDAGRFLYLERLGEVLKDGGMMRMTFGVFVLHYLLMSSFVVFPLLMLGTGEIAADEHHLYYFSLLLVTFILMGPLMRLSDRRAYTLKIAIAMIGTFIAANLVLALGGGLYAVLIGMVLFFMAFNLLEVVLPAMVTRIAPDGFRGTAMGVYSSAQFAGAFFGGAIGGFVAGGWEISYVLWINALICLVWIGVTIGLKARLDLAALEPRVYRLEGNPACSTQEVIKAVLSVRGVRSAELTDSGAKARIMIDPEEFDASAMTAVRVNGREIISA